jgi:hypothetical protein
MPTGVKILISLVILDGAMANVIYSMSWKLQEVENLVGSTLWQIVWAIGH